jgi:hypothetical protein
MRASTGRWCELNKEQEVIDLQPGMDFRNPIYRRETFHRFYQFHLRYKSHPGIVYNLIPEITKYLELGKEERFWLAFLNGNTQNPITSFLILINFPNLKNVRIEEFSKWYNSNWKRLDFDQDRRHWKSKLVEAVTKYRDLVGESQIEYFRNLCPDKRPEKNFPILWQQVREKFFGFGRLSAWSYLEYLSIIGVPIAPDQLFLEDMEGSRSHRNGLCKVLGRDDLDWHASNPGFDGLYSKKILKWLAEEGALLLTEAKSRSKGQPWYRETNYFTLESALCTYKSWFRPNRRYPGCYQDMLHDRIKKAQANWPEIDLNFFWKSREYLPRQLRLECNPKDLGLKPIKQNFYRDTGCPPMMGIDDPAFVCEYNEFFLEKY